MVWPIQQQPSNYYLNQQGRFPAQPPQYQPTSGIQQLLTPQNTQRLLSPERISNFSHKLSSLQQILKTVQSAAPMIQQYGPMLKNLPTMFQLMKALNDSEEEDTEKLDTTESLSEGEDNSLPAEKHLESVQTDANEDVGKTGESTPKLFI
ncbi:hypothetical protein FH966_12900 [Lentibacillus cibarius]|uniref:YqfQ-like protein n=1 Tax=Lentibacillus cibarius TaxID=2583219 RepID=A0A549YKX6_9BACI|nr:VrrA/YqfQ family protein [Lentibacillus cibarius]TRM12523.1 hypothetical protein FH966_12900 [Lentibacillus cibarius]